MLYDYANGLEDSPVSHYYDREKIKSVGNGITFRRNLTGLEDIKVAVSLLSDTVAGRLRKYRMKGFGVKVDIKDPDFKVITRQKQMDKATNLSEEIAAQAIGIIQASWKLQNPIRLLTITAINLCDEGEDEQLTFFDGNARRHEKAEKAERAMDEIRAKFGDRAITYGRVLNNDIVFHSDGNDE